MTSLKNGDSTMADGKLNAFGTRCRSALTWLFLVLLIVEVKSAHCQEPDKPSLKETASSRTGQEEANDEITEFQGVLILPYELLVDYPAGEDDIKKLSTASHILFDPGVDDINEASPRQITDELVRKVIKHTPELRILQMYGAAVSNDILADVGKLKHLEVFDLHDTEISNQGLAHLKKLPRLRKLDLLYCPINSRGLRHLQSISTLEILILDQTYIEDEGLEYLRSLKSLKELSLAQTFVTDAGIECLQSLEGLSSLLFLYSHVLGIELGELEGIIWARRTRRLPVVLTRSEVNRVLSHLRGDYWLIAMLLYGGGLRLNVALNLRVKELDFERGEILVREGKGGKDRVTILPSTVIRPLQDHLVKVGQIHTSDLARIFHPRMIDESIRGGSRAVKGWGT
jgi:hypothetical protein